MISYKQSYLGSGVCDEILFWSVKTYLPVVPLLYVRVHQKILFEDKSV